MLVVAVSPWDTTINSGRERALLPRGRVRPRRDASCLCADYAFARIPLAKTLKYSGGPPGAPCTVVLAFLSCAVFAQSVYLGQLMPVPLSDDVSVAVQ